VRKQKRSDLASTDRQSVADELRGQKAIYAIGEVLGQGQAGITYRATVLERPKEDPQLSKGQTVVVKLPNISPAIPLPEQMRLYAQLQELTAAEYSSLQKLRAGIQKTSCDGSST
jgi:hypothetical protein